MLIKTVAGRAEEAWSVQTTNKQFRSSSQ